MKIISFDKTGKQIDITAVSIDLKEMPTLREAIKSLLEDKEDGKAKE